MTFIYNFILHAASEIEIHLECMIFVVFPCAIEGTFLKYLHYYRLFSQGWLDNLGIFNFLPWPYPLTLTSNLQGHGWIQLAIPKLVGRYTTLDDGANISGDMA